MRVEQHAVEQIYLPWEVAAIFRVNPKTVIRWTRVGKFGPEGETWFRTLGGHTRYRRERVDALVRRTMSPRQQ